MLLDATSQLRDKRSWLVIGGEASLVAGILEDHPDADVRWGPVDVRDLDRAGPVLEGVPATRLTIQDDPARLVDDGETFDAVVFETSLHRPLVRRWLAQAHRVLVDGGTVLVAGANDAGVRSAIGDAKHLFGDPVGEDYRRRHRVAAFRRGGDPAEWPYWFDHPGIAPGTWQSFDLNVRGHTLALATLPGVFPGDRLDAGTALLLEHLSIASGARVLDAGCGAGVIGLLAARLGAGRVDLVDASLLAVTAARKNVARLGVAGARVLASDVYDAVPGERYDLIVSNPPFHRGKAIDLAVADRLIREAPAHLHPGGSLLIVANAFLAYGKRMDRVFRQVETVAASRQYHVISARDPR
jgi:16S rRNA (guanine1207-N2)-methyltransferase